MKQNQRKQAFIIKPLEALSKSIPQTSHAARVIASLRWWWACFGLFRDMASFVHFVAKRSRSSELENMGTQKKNCHTSSGKQAPEQAGVGGEVGWGRGTKDECSRWGGAGVQGGRSDKRLSLSKHEGQLQLKVFHWLTGSCK